MNPTPSRRAVVGASAWSVPAVAVGVAAPAFAGSSTPTGQLTYIAGTPRVIAQQYVNYVNYLLEFDGTGVEAVVTDSPPPLPSTLTMTVTRASGDVQLIATDPSNWDADWELTSESVSELLFRRRADLTPGSTVALAASMFGGVSGSGTPSVVELAFSSPGYLPDTGTITFSLS